MDNNKEEIENIEENNQESIVEIDKEDGKAMKFFKNILSGAIDQIVTIISGLILYLIISLILKVVGYKIVMREEMFLIVFIISNVLYYPLVQEFLGGKTLGRKLVKR